MIRMDSPHILVHEYVSGGGWPEPELPAGLTAEARAMLRAVLADLNAWGMVRTTTTIDARLPYIDLAADRLVPLSPDRHMPTLEKLALECGAALVIAPESKGVLGRITQRLESLDVLLLGANSDAVSIAADKWQCYQLFRENAIPTPETCLVTRDDVINKAAGLNPPWVVKPRDGVAAEGVGLATDLASLCRAQTLARSGSGQCLLQSYIPGVHASVSLLSNGKDTLALSLNQQKIEVGVSFAYRGGRIPLQHPLEQRAFALAQRAVSLIPGLRGYVGVDLVMTPNECYVLEINPRITTSYVGLRWVIDLNLAEAIWDSCSAGRLPKTATVTGTVSFSKDGTLG
jgi:predicted ATP-grasp superfamily ATP-dependent carboligase